MVQARVGSTGSSSCTVSMKLLLSAIALLAPLAASTSIIVAEAAAAAATPSSVPRGVRPSRAKFYSGVDVSGDLVFRCLDGSGDALPLSRINDDYCDCVDGSDEPGTSACSNGVFYCANLGSVPKLINASAVDDGVCDCCDGSDELFVPPPSSKRATSPSPPPPPPTPSAVRCPDTCAAEGAAAASAARAAADAAAAGAAARERAISKARRERASWQRSLSRLEAEVEKAEALAEELRGPKEAAEKEEEEERERERKDREERETKEREERDKAKEKGSIDGGAAAAATEEQGGAAAGGPAAAPPAPAADAPDAPAASDAPDAPAAPEAAEEATGAEELDPEEAGRRIASQWTHDPEAAGASVGTAGVPDDGVPPTERHHLHRHAGGQLTLAAAAAAAARKGIEAALALARSVSSAERGKLPTSPREPPPVEESPREAAKRAFRDAERAARELREKRLDVATKAKLDLGPDASFATLLGECASTDVDKYTYTVCFFDGATQVEKGGHGGTISLGTWAGWGPGVPEATTLPPDPPAGVGGGEAAPADESDADSTKRAALATKEGPDGSLPPRSYSTMRFSDGARCWQGPPRSLTLSVSCGRSTRISSFEEPSRCEYVASLETPSACDEAAVSRAREEAERKVASAAGKDPRDEL